MDDLVKRLRATEGLPDGYGNFSRPRNPDGLEAADRIEALEAELASGSFYKESDIDALQERVQRAEAALEVAVAAAYEDAAGIAQKFHDEAMEWASAYLKSFDGETDSKRIADRIRSRTDADALAALDAVKAEARREERERCAKIIEDSDVPTRYILAAAIRAEAEGEG